MTQRKRTQKTHEVQAQDQDQFDTFIQVATKQDPEEEPRPHPHRYNPRSNAFGTLEPKEPKEPKPMTMAQRLTQKTPKMQMQAPIPLPDLGPKSQFWWQDLDD